MPQRDTHPFGRWDKENVYTSSGDLDKESPQGDCNSHTRSSLSPARSGNVFPSFFLLSLRCATKNNYTFNAINIEIPRALCTLLWKIFRPFVHF